jgi:DNA-binding beta-propeller fold protein YncE
MIKLALFAALVLPPSRAGAADGGYRLVHEYKVGGEGGWDYLTFDPAGRRLFIARATRVQVFDVASGNVTAEIQGTTGVHGVALAPDLGRGYASDGKSGAATVFDLKTLETLATIVLPGRNPDAIVYEPASHRVLAFEGGSRDAAVIDARRGQVVATIALPGKPEFAAVDGKGAVFVNIEDANELLVLDAAKAAVVRTIPLAPCEEPTGLSIDVASRRLFAGCRNKLMAVVDPDAGKVVATLPIGAGVDATAFDPASRTAFSSNGEGSLTVIREDGPSAFAVAQNAATQKGARTMAVDPSTHRVYVVTADLKAPEEKGGRPKPVDGTFRVLVLERGSTAP